MAHGEQTRSESVEVFSASAVSGFVLFGQFLPIGTKLETSFNVNKHVTSTSKMGMQVTDLTKQKLSLLFR